MQEHRIATPAADPNTAAPVLSRASEARDDGKGSPEGGRFPSSALDRTPRATIPGPPRRQPRGLPRGERVVYIQPGLPGMPPWTP